MQDLSSQQRLGISLVVQSVKNQPAMQETTCDGGDLGSVPGLERSPGEGIGSLLQFAWEITWTEESSDL